SRVTRGGPTLFRTTLFRATRHLPLYALIADWKLAGATKSKIQPLSFPPSSPRVTTEVSPAPAKTASRTRASPLLGFSEQVFLRTTGAPLKPGNSLRILEDSTENYPAWLEAI